MPRAITKLPFKALPAAEQAALQGGIAALNAVTGYKNKRAAVTAAEIEAAAFKLCGDLHQRGDTDYLRESIKATGRSKGWSDVAIETTRAADVQKSYDLNFVAAVVQMGDVLEALIRTKTLLARGGSFASLAATFNSDVNYEPARVVLTEKGFAEIDMQMRFRSALGLIAYTILRLSKLRADGHVVLRCAECKEFKIVAVRKPRNFCCAAHRNIYNVRAFRVRAARRHR